MFGYTGYREASFLAVTLQSDSTVSSLCIRTTDSYDIVADQNEFRRILHQGIDAASASIELIKNSNAHCARSYDFVIALWRAKEHSPSRKLLEYRC